MFKRLLVIYNHLLRMVYLFNSSKHGAIHHFFSFKRFKKKSNGKKALHPKVIQNKLETVLLFESFHHKEYIHIYLRYFIFALNLKKKRIQ